MLFRSQVNGDTTWSNYSGTWVAGSGSSASSGRYTGSNGFLWLSMVNTNSTSNSTISRFNIMNYASSSTYKTVLVRNDNATTWAGAQVGLYRGTTNAITSLTVMMAGSSFIAGSTFTLYGVGTSTNTLPYATGGNSIYQDSTYWYHLFTSSGTFTPSQALSADYLVVAGGGGGDGYVSGGGGAGGLRCTVDATGGGGSLESKLSLSSGTGYTVTVGAGGSVGGNGGNSVFSTITSTRSEEHTSELQSH